MQYRTHIVTSITVGAAIAAYSSIPFTLSYTVGVMIGSLLPDIDEPNSYVGRRSFGIAKTMKKVFGHRGMTHSLVALLIMAYLLLRTSDSFFFMGIIIGYALHILEDLFSMQGVPLFWPFRKKKIRLPIHYRTGGSIEKIIYYAAIAIFVYIIIYYGLVDEFLHSID